MSDVLQPFADAKSLTIGGLTVENDADRVSLYGSADFTRDKLGLEQARKLKAVLDAVCEALAGDTSLPDKIAGPDNPDRVRNPFQ